MRQRFDTWKEPFEQWYYPKNFLWDPPNSVIDVTNAYSNDLVKSEGHQISLLGARAGSLKLDIGGPFMVIRREYKESSGSLGNNVDFSQSSDPFDPNPYQGHYRTKQHAANFYVNNGQFPEATPSSKAELDMKGTEAIANCAPTKSYAELSQAGGEALADGFPSIIGLSSLKSRAGAAHAAGSEYLNVEFGWKPLISDVRKLARAVLDSERILDQYEKDSGKEIHRRYDFPTELKIENHEYGPYIPVPRLEYGFYKPGKSFGNLTYTLKWKRRTWFKGCFTYYFPPRGDAMRKSAEARKLLGLELTPATLWNLAPWSWAVDWFANVGNVLDAFDNLTTDGLQMPYAYIMEETSHELEWTNRGVEYASYSGSPTLTQTYTTTCKVREPATPWGFGFDMSSMTARQWAILVALGLVRGNKRP